MKISRKFSIQVPKERECIKLKVNKENASKLWKMIQEAGDYLRG